MARDRESSPLTTLPQPVKPRVFGGRHIVHRQAFVRACSPPMNRARSCQRNWLRNLWLRHENMLLVPLRRATVGCVTTITVSSRRGSDVSSRFVATLLYMACFMAPSRGRGSIAPRTPNKLIEKLNFTPFGILATERGQKRKESDFVESQCQGTPGSGRGQAQKKR